MERGVRAVRRATRFAGLAGIARAAVVAGAVVQLAQRAAQGVNLPFIGQLLAFGKFDQFQYLLHLIHGALEGVNDRHHFVNGLTDGRAARRGFGLGDALGQALHALDKRCGRG